MKSQLKAGALLSYVVLVLQNLVGLLYTPFMLRMMGKSEYGLYSIAASIVAYLTVLDLGFGNAMVRYTAKYRAEGRAEEQYKMFGMFFLIYCAIGFVALAAGGVLYFNAENIFDSAMTVTEMSRTKIILVLMVANLAISFPFGLFGSVITAYEQFVFQKGIVIVRIILNTTTMIVLLTYGYKAVAMVVVTTIFNILTLGSNYWYCKHYLKIKLKFGGFQWGFLKEVSIYSFWIFLNAIMDRFYWSSGQFILGSYVGTAAVAVFAVAVQLKSMYSGFATSISSIFLPRLTAMTVSDKDGSAISNLFVKTGRIQFCVMALIFSGFVLFGKQFILLWAGSGYSEAYTISLLFFTAMFVPLIQSLGIFVLQARNQMKFRSLLYLFISLVCVCAQVPLAKLYGGVGCAYAIAGALILGETFVINIYYYAKQKMDVIRFWFEIAKMSVVPGALTVGAYYVLERFVLDSWLSLGLGIAAYMLVYLPLFFVFSMNKFERGLILNPVRKLLDK